jgi:hypothetical protein
MTKIIGMDHAPLLERLVKVLDSESDVVRQQVAIELLMSRHAMATGDAAIALYVIESMCKHAKQLMKAPI